MDDEGLSLREPRKRPEHVYLRFGKFSKRERSLNHATHEYERGVSVYRATLDNGIVSLINDPALFWTVAESIEALHGRMIFPVTGKEQYSLGSDGEPVLTAIRLLPYAIDYNSIPKALKGN
jgi:hypothetical protein